MLSYSDLFEQKLRQLIMEEVDKVLDLISNGLSVGDFAEYKQQVGKIAALRTTLELIDEARMLANQAR